MGYIYKITNTVNGKEYVGQTKRDIPTRWHEHLYYSHHKNRGYNCILHSAIRKYGDDAFIVEEIEQCDNSMLMEREMFWIKKLGTTRKGYNLSKGGQGWNKCPDEDIMRYWNEGYSMSEIATKMPLHAETISKRLQAMGIPKQDIIDRGNLKAKMRKSRTVYQYDTDGNYIRSFRSLGDAQKSIGGRRACIGEINYAFGFKWSYTKANKLPKEH